MNKDKQKEKINCDCGSECACGDKCESCGKDCKCSEEECKSDCDACDCKCCQEGECAADCKCVCGFCQHCRCHDKDNKCECGKDCKCVDETELKQLQGELLQEKQSKVQLLADFVNYRKRSEKEREEMQVFANRMILGQIVDVVDDFDRAIQLEADKVSTANDFYKGVVIIRRKFAELLAAYGLEEVKAEVGGEFNPATMEAVTTAPATNKEHVNKIIHVAAKGYVNKNNGQIFRTVKVIIGK